MDKESTQATAVSVRKYETPRLVDYGRLHSHTTGGTAHAVEPHNPGKDKPRP
jgi:hypothetical protein